MKKNLPEVGLGFSFLFPPWARAKKNKKIKKNKKNEEELQRFVCFDDFELDDLVEGGQRRQNMEKSSQ